MKLTTRFALLPVYFLSVFDVANWMNFWFQGFVEIVWNRVHSRHPFQLSFLWKVFTNMAVILPYKSSQRSSNWEISFSQTMLHEIWVQDLFSRDSFYCPVRLPSTSSCDIKPLWSSDAIWLQGSRWTLVQVMACCLRHQAITWTSVDLSSMRSLGIHLRALSLDTVKITVNKTR